MNKTKITARTKARARAVDVLYEAQIKDLDTSAGIWGLSQERQDKTTAQTPIPEYAAQILDGISEHLNNIDTALENYAQGWTLARMPRVDLAILRVATWELLYNRELDPPIIIDEAIKIAKEKSTDKSPNFINGLLGRIKDLRDVIAPVQQTNSQAQSSIQETSGGLANSSPGITDQYLNDAIDQMLKEEN